MKIKLLILLLLLGPLTANANPYHDKTRFDLPLWGENGVVDFIAPSMNNATLLSKDFHRGVILGTDDLFRNKEGKVFKENYRGDLELLTKTDGWVAGIASLDDDIILQASLSARW